MDAVISGSAGEALLISKDGELRSFSVDDADTLIPRTPADLAFLFGESKDLQILENVGLEQVQRQLRHAYEFACALDLALVSLDRELSTAVRERAAGELEKLLTSPSVIDELKGIFYKRPLPRGADLAGAIQCCLNSQAKVFLTLLRQLRRDQKLIREQWLAGEAGLPSVNLPPARSTKGEGLKIASQISRTARERRPMLGSTYPSTDSFDADVICFSHLRWDFFYQRPQHLLSRCAKERRVFFVEEPIFGEGALRLDVSRREDNLYVVVPHLPEGLLSDIAVEAIQQALIDRLIAEHKISDYVLWYYTPMALGWTRHLKPLATIYDCMDELSAFKNAPRALREREAELFRRADVVFTGGQSLYEAKLDKHPNVHAFPSSIDRAHFAQAREIAEDPADQAAIPHPRLGFFGVVDERFDTQLLDQVAAARPDWHFVVIGPVVKISEEDLPKHPNIHYLGGKSYKELPAYLAGWDVAALFFACNEHTRFISPTKTPEYLAAGKPVVSTPIRDVVRPYGDLGLVRIADDAAEFIRAASEIGMDMPAKDDTWLARVDEHLAKQSWDSTWVRMAAYISEVVAQHKGAARRKFAVASNPAHFGASSLRITGKDLSSASNFLQRLVS